MTEIDAGRLYAGARESISDLVRSLSQGRLAAPVPGQPGLTVHDVISHLAGVATDAVNTVDDGPSEDAAARHVADRSDTPTSVVLREWERSSSQFEVLLTKGGQRLPAEVLDVITCEHDIRGAVGMPGSREDDPLRAAASLLMSQWLGRVDSAVLDPVAIIDGSGTVIAGPEGAPVSFRASPFEFFRGAVGRRSANQLVRRFSGTTDPASYVDLLCLNGCSPTDIVE